MAPQPASTERLELTPKLPGHLLVANDSNGPTAGIGFKLWILVCQSAIRDRPRPRITRGFALLPPDCDLGPGAENGVSEPRLLKTS
jgi:hypothetical protein